MNTTDSNAIDFSFDELNSNKSQNNENSSKNKINNFLFTCSTPRQSNDLENKNLIENDELFEKYAAGENNTELEKPASDQSCDLLRSSKIDLDGNSDMGYVNNAGDDNTDADITANSIYSNFKSNEKIINNDSHSHKQITNTYNSPINQLNLLLKNIKINYNNNAMDHQLDESENNYDEDSLVLSKFRTDLSSIMNNNNNKLNSMIGDTNKYLKSSSNLITNNNGNGDLKGIIEKEVLKRQHCEKQIEELNKKILQLDEQLTVVTALDHKKENFINKLDKNLNKIMNSWKDQENQLQMSMNKLKQDKHLALLNEANCINRVKFLEEEMRQLNSELVNEKVKYQEQQREKNNEIQNLKKELGDLQKSDFEKSNRIEKLQNQVTLSRDEKDSLEQRIVVLSRKIEDENTRNEAKHNEMTLKLNTLTDANEKITAQYESMQVEYEQLLKEAKMVVQESERQYHSLVANVESEKRAKDALQVEISVLEEKLDNTILQIQSDHDNEKKNLEKQFSEKEKILNEKYKTELNEVTIKHQIEFDTMKAKLKNEIDFRTQDCDDKTRSLNRKIEILECEIKSLTEANKNLENERNSIRFNLKQMLELQMKEAMQLLGLSGSTNADTTVATKDTHEQHLLPPSPPPSFTSFTFPKIPSPLPQLPSSIVDSFSTNKNDSKYKFDETQMSFSKRETFQNFNMISPIEPNVSNTTKKMNSNLYDELPLIEAKSMNTEGIDLGAAGSSIKDLFIKYQIDLINKCYNIDENNQTQTENVSNHEGEEGLQIEKSDNRSNNMNYSDSNNNNNKSSKSSSTSLNEQSFEQNRSSKRIQNASAAVAATAANSLLNTSRTHELRYFIEMLLDKSPNGQDSSEAADEAKKQLNLDELSKPNLASSPIINMQTTPPSNALNNYQSDINDDLSSCYYTNSHSYTNNIAKKHSSQSYLSDDDNYGDYDKKERFRYKNSENFDDIRRNLNFDFNNITPPSNGSTIEVVSKISINKQQESMPPQQKTVSKSETNKKPNTKVQSVAKKIESHVIGSQNQKLRNAGLSNSNQSLMESSVLSINNKTQNTTTSSVSTTNNTTSTNSLAANKQKRVWK